VVWRGRDAQSNIIYAHLAVAVASLICYSSCSRKNPPLPAARGNTRFEKNAAMVKGVFDPLTPVDFRSGRYGTQLEHHSFVLIYRLMNASNSPQ
jgi:hypothetical protein